MKREEFFLCFGFEGHENNLREYHVTHTYLGHVSFEEMTELVGKVDFYFQTKRHYMCPFPVLFSQRALFGPEKNIPVLLPVSVSKQHTETNFMGQLREYVLDHVAPGVFIYPFNPHLTTKRNEFKGTVNKLYLCGKSYRVIKKWEL